jgi:predicted acylesterase/phospholipase RssA
MNETLKQRIQSPGPKRILSCDGGGIRGLMSVEVLARIEADLRAAYGKPDMVLADFFDLTCGTSTGAIVAACVSAGMTTAQMRSFYVDSGEQMFDKASLLKRLRYSYNSEPLALLLQRALNKALGLPEHGTPALLGDAGLRSLLLMVMRNHTTDSPWFVTNHPLAKYNDLARPDCNLNLPLWQLVRASTAAPTYFPPEVVVFGKGTEREYPFIFVDGGITGYNNPAFLAFETATAAPYRVMWPTGTEQLLIVSVGTGKVPLDRPDDEASDLNLIMHAQTLPLALMNAATDGWDLACRTLGACRFGGAIDREVGDMLQPHAGPATSSTPKLFTYVRYDPLLTRQGLDDLGLRDILPAHVQQLDSVQRIPDIRRVGVAYAEAAYRRAQLAPFVPG